MPLTCEDATVEEAPCRSQDTFLVSERTGWDRGLSVTADGKGLVGHAGAVLLRKLADRTGLTRGWCANRP